MADNLVVVIPTAGRPELLSRTLRSLGECKLPAIFRETIVVENGPRHGAQEVVREAHPALRARYMYQEEGNKSKALNKVIDQVGDCLLFQTDDDVRFSPGTLQAYAEASAGITKGCIFGGPLSVDYEEEPPQWLKSFLPAGYYPDWTPTADPPVFMGVNWAAFSSDVQDAGGFAIDRGPGAPAAAIGQELEMQHRLLRRGLRSMYVPEAMVWHYVPTSRCSASWVLRRIHREGISIGFDQGDVFKGVLGVPRWLVRKWVTTILRVGLTRLSLNATARFSAQYEFALWSGAVKGCRMRKTPPSKRPSAIWE